MAAKRPLGVTIVAILYLLLGLLWLMTALVDVFTSESSLPWLFAGIVYIILALGMFGGWNWVWYLGVIMALVSIGLALYGWYSADWSTDALWGALGAMIIPVIILWYLFRRNVKEFFFGS
jgi:hypothetical protein